MTPEIAFRGFEDRLSTLEQSFTTDQVSSFRSSGGRGRPPILWERAPPRPEPDGGTPGWGANQSRSLREVQSSPHIFFSKSRTVANSAE